MFLHAIRRVYAIYAHRLRLPSSYLADLHVFPCLFSRAVCVRPQKRGSLMRFYRFGTMKNRTRPFVRPRVPASPLPFDYRSITVIGGVFHAHVTRAACIWPSVVASSPFKFDDFTTISPRLIEGIETRRRNGTAVRAPCTCEL